MSTVQIMLVSLSNNREDYKKRENISKVQYSQIKTLTNYLV